MPSMISLGQILKAYGISSSALEAEWAQFTAPALSRCSMDGAFLIHPITQSACDNGINQILHKLFCKLLFSPFLRRFLD